MEAEEVITGDHDLARFRRRSEGRMKERSACAVPRCSMPCPPLADMPLVFKSNRLLQNSFL